MPDNKVIEELVDRYLDYWRNSDIDGLISMYHPQMSYYDMPSGDVANYGDVRQFLTNSFAAEKNQQLKLNDPVYIEGNSAFIYWLQSFSTAESDKKARVNGVELIVFREQKIISIHEFYDYQVAAKDEVSSPGEGTHQEKLTKLGLDDTQMQTIASEITTYFEQEQPYLEPSLNLHSVSEKLGYTRNQVSYVINHVLGRTFYDLVNGQRVDYVMQQMSLGKSSHSILEIAINAGFNSVSGFYSAFKKNTGMTPAQYQRSLKSD